MASVTRRNTKNGERRYDVRYRDSDGKVHTETKRTLRDAKHTASTVDADKLRGAWIDPRNASRTFRQVADDWLGSNVAKRASTYARDESILRVHLLPELADSRIGKVNPARVRGLVDAWSCRFEARTVRRMYGVLRAVFAFAVESSVIVASPCRGVKLPAVEPIKRHVVTADELGRLADALGPDYALMPYLGAMLGLRWGEVAGLRVGRVDLLGRTVTVSEQVTRGLKGTSYSGRRSRPRGDGRWPSPRRSPTCLLRTLPDAASPRPTRARCSSLPQTATCWSMRTTGTESGSLPASQRASAP